MAQREWPDRSRTRAGPRRIQMLALPPSRASRIVGPLLLWSSIAWFALPLLWQWMTFVPSNAWSVARWVPIALIGLGSGFWFGYWGQENARWHGRSLSPVMRIGGLYLFIPLFTTWMAWWNLSFVLPGIVTRLVGAHHHEVMTLHKTHPEHTAGDLDCHFRIEGAPFLDSRDHYYCAFEREWNALPADGEMEVWYSSSWFGRRYQFIAAHDPSFHRVS